jgi:hypothetical protein
MAMVLILENINAKHDRFNRLNDSGGNVYFLFARLGICAEIREPAV